MGLYEASGNLMKSTKDLMLKWQHTRTLWNDAQADAVEKETLADLEKDVRTATEAMDQMKTVVSSARRDCQQG